MNQTIYAVSSGSYSDYGINAMFSTRELAQAFIDAREWSHYDQPEIEEWELDPNPNTAREGYDWYRVTMALQSGDAALADKRERSPYSPIPEDNVYDARQGGAAHALVDGKWQLVSAFTTYVEARNQKQAIKVANKRRANWISSHKIGKDFQRN